MTLLYTFCEQHKTWHVDRKVWWLIWNAFVHSVGSSNNRSKRQTAHCQTFVLSSCLTAVLAMSHCCSVQIKGLAYKPSNRATTRRTTTHCLVCFTRDGTTRLERNNLLFRALLCCHLLTRRKGGNDIGCVIAIDNATSPP